MKLKSDMIDTIKTLALIWGIYLALSIWAKWDGPSGTWEYQLVSFLKGLF